MMATARAGDTRLDVTERGALLVTVSALGGGDRPEPGYTHCRADGPPRLRRRTLTPDELRGRREP